MSEYDEATANEFHVRRNDMRERLVAVLNRWFDGALKIDPHSEMVVQLTDEALGLKVSPNPLPSPLIAIQAETKL